MAVAVVAVHRSQGLVVENRDIGRIAGDKAAERSLEEPAAHLGIVLEEHLRNLAPGNGGIAEIMLVEHVRDLHRLKHVVRVAVGSETGQYALAHDLQCGRASYGIAHVRLGIVDHHRVGLFDQVHLVLIHIDAVAENGVGAEDVVVHESVDNALVMLVQAVVQVLDAFGDVDVITRVTGERRNALVESFVGKSELRVHSEHAREHIGVVLLAVIDEVNILLDRLVALLLTVAVGGLVAKT